MSPNLRGIIFMVLVDRHVRCQRHAAQARDRGAAAVPDRCSCAASRRALWCLPLVHRHRQPQAAARRRANGWVVLRNICELGGGAVLRSSALAQLPLADITAINQTAPMLLLIGVRAASSASGSDGLRMGLIALGFLGALLVAQPTGAGRSRRTWCWGSAAPLGSAVRDLAGRKVPAGHAGAGGRVLDAAWW